MFVDVLVVDGVVSNCKRAEFLVTEEGTSVP